MPCFIDYIAKPIFIVMQIVCILVAYNFHGISGIQHFVCSETWPEKYKDLHGGPLHCDGNSCDTTNLLSIWAFSNE